MNFSENLLSLNKRESYGRLIKNIIYTSPVLVVVTIIEFFIIVNIISDVLNKLKKPFNNNLLNFFKNF